MGGRTPVVAIVLLRVTLVPLPYVGRLILSVHSTTIQTFTLAASGDIGSLISTTGSNILAAFQCPAC